MLFLRKTASDPDLFDIVSDITADLVVVAKGQTELEVRRYFRQRAIEQARKGVDSLLRDIP